MPVIQFETAIAAAGSNSNFVAGSAYEFARRRSIFSCGVTASATGSFVTIQAGADVVAEEFTPSVKTAFPVIPDDMYYTDVMEPGDRLVIKGRNPTGGSITFRGIVQIQEVG